VFIIRFIVPEKVLQSKENNVGFEVDSVALGQLPLISSMLHVAFHSSIIDYTRYSQYYDTVAKSTTEEVGYVSQNKLQSGF